MDNKELLNVDVCYTNGEEVTNDIKEVYTYNALTEISKNKFKLGFVIGSGVSLVCYLTTFGVLYFVNKKIKHNNEVEQLDD